MDETLPITSSDDSAIKRASRSTDIHVGVTADTVQDNARVTGIAVGAIQGPVTINVTGPAVDLAAIRRAAVQALLQPVLDLRDFEPETIPIPGGPFPLGRADPAAPVWERSCTVNLPDYRIGRYPVMVREYAAFITDVKAQPAPSGWFNREPPAGLLDHPVTNVSWCDAVAYCAWLSEQCKPRRYVLPSEAEWEKATAPTPPPRAGEGLSPRYPWGEEWVEGRCNAASSGTTAVTAHPAGASGYGVEDLLGNVQEWTRSLWGSQPGQPDFGYPYDRKHGREIIAPTKLPAQVRLVHRGGSFKSQPADLRCTARGNALPDSRIAWRGFRVAMILEEPT